jgi:hypothetical protein
MPARAFFEWPRRLLDDAKLMGQPFFVAVDDAEENIV